MGSAFAPAANLMIGTPLGRPLLRLSGVHPDHRFRRFIGITSFASGAAIPTVILDSQNQGIGRLLPRHSPATIILRSVWPRSLYSRRPDIASSWKNTARLLRQPMLSRVSFRSPPLGQAEHRHARATCQTGFPDRRHRAFILTLRDQYIDLLPNNEDAITLAAQTFMIDEFLARLEEDGGVGIQ
jgi:hypothetical protein